MVEFSTDVEIRKIPDLIADLFEHILYDEDPNYWISDEAAILDVSMEMPEVLIPRLTEHYGKPITLADLKLPLWKLLRRLNDCETFEDSLAKFRDFLAKNNYPPNVVWVTPEDVLPNDHRVIYVKMPVSPTNERRVRELYDLSRNEKRGILFETICLTSETTYANAWMPKDVNAAVRNMMNNDLKLSIKTGMAKIPGKTVPSPLRWKYLRWKLRKNLNGSSALFSHDGFVAMIRES
jgi:hypothetical protein